VPQTDDILELFLRKEHVENTTKHDAFSLDFIELLFDDLSFLLMLVLHLENFFGSCFVLLSQLSQLLSHIFDLIL
jgi:hypothetical protein